MMYDFEDLNRQVSNMSDEEREQFFGVVFKLLQHINHLKSGGMIPFRINFVDADEIEVYDNENPSYGPRAEDWLRGKQETIDATHYSSENNKKEVIEVRINFQHGKLNWSYNFELKNQAGKLSHDIIHYFWGVVIQELFTPRKRAISNERMRFYQDCWHWFLADLTWGALNMQQAWSAEQEERYRQQLLEGEYLDVREITDNIPENFIITIVNNIMSNLQNKDSQLPITVSLQEK